jgi:Fe-S-cluster containining protein
MPRKRNRDKENKQTRAQSSKSSKKKNKKDNDKVVNKNEKEIDNKTKTTQEDKPPRFRFVCQKCRACCKSEDILISIPDLARWVMDNTIYRVIHLMKMTGEEGNYKIILKKDVDGYCNLYHHDNKLCTIYNTRPLICRSYPLSYDGEQYKLKSKNCPGLDQNGMTKDHLKAIRDDTFEEFIAFRQMNQVLPVLYGLIFTKLIEDSQEFMQKMSDSDNVKDLGELANKKGKGNDSN